MPVPSKPQSLRASDPKLRQTKASALELHNTLPQCLWSSRAEAEYAKRKQLIKINLPLGDHFARLSPSPALVIAACYLDWISRLRVKRPKV